MRIHRVKFGENLADISRYYYGNPDRQVMIVAHNPDDFPTGVGNNVYPGQELVIPHLPEHLLSTVFHGAE